MKNNFPTYDNFETVTIKQFVHRLERVVLFKRPTDNLNVVISDLIETIGKEDYSTGVTFKNERERLISDVALVCYHINNLIGCATNAQRVDFIVRCLPLIIKLPINFFKTINSYDEIKNLLDLDVETTIKLLKLQYMG